MMQQDGAILVVGAGAVGGYIAAHLARAGHQVTVLEPWEPNRAAIAADGLSVEEPSGNFATPLPVLAAFSEVSRLAPRLTILCSKLGEADAAVHELERHYSGPYLVTLNALADFDLARRLGAERVMGCIVTGLFAHLVAPGHLRRHRSRGEGAATFRLGEVAGQPTPRLQAATTLLSQVDTAETVHDLAAARWSKLVFNCMTSPLSALHARPIRDLFLEASLRREMVQVALEVVRAATAAGVVLDPICGIAGTGWAAAARQDDPAALEAGLMAYGTKLDPKAISGMAQDRARGRRTEVALINGAALREAQLRGMDAPANAALVARLDGATAG
jgi:2-dehydropantoate 2-reductase